MLPVIYIGSVPIPVYGTLIAFSYITGIILISNRAYIYGFTKGNVFICSTLAAVGMLVGAKLLYFITVLPILIKNRDIIMASPVNAIYYALSGYVFYGGLLGALLMIFLYCIQMDIRFSRFMNVITPAIPFIHSIGRLGCFMGGCCYGIPYKGPFCVHFPHNPFITELDSVPRFPVQLLEATALFAIFILFYKNSKHIYDDGLLIKIYLAAYAVLRFFTEFLRGDAIRGFILNLSISQWISLSIAIIMIYSIFSPQKNSG